MKSAVKLILKRSALGRAIWNYLHRKKNAFRSASYPSFSHLDRWGRKKTIDRIFEKSFGDIFILMDSLGVGGDVFEFGTYNGYTALLLAKHIRMFQMKGASLHLFDSFQGLPEAKEIDTCSYEFHAASWRKGSIAASEGIEKVLHRRLAKILSSDRVQIVKGFFEESIESHFAKMNFPKASLVHLDCDLYSSTKYVLDFLLKNELLQDGTILIFDDWMTSRGNPNLGQRRAVKEVLGTYPAWSFEKYSNYGGGSHVFIAHDTRVVSAEES